MAGLFFCLASAEGAGLLFCPDAIQPHTSVYSAFYAVNAVYTTHSAKQRTRICRLFSCDLPHSTAANNRPTQAAIIPPAPRWSTSQRRSTSSTYQIPPSRPDAVQVNTAAYYNKVYKGAAVRLAWIHAGRCSISQTMQARRGQLLPCADRWQVLHLAHLLMGQPGGVSMLPTPGISLAPG